MYCPNDDVKKSKRLPRGGLAVLLGLLLALAVLAAGAVPALAASVSMADVSGGEENQGAAAQAVQARLATLQQAYIQPEWLPDIRANETAVQALLDDYLALTADGRAELSAQNNSDLRAYFAALYEVQGKSAAGVDALFEESSAAGYMPPAPSKPPEPVSIAPSSVSLPAPSSSVPQSQPPPPQSQAPTTPAGGDSWSSRTLSTGALLVLAAVAVVLFARFVVALRRAGKGGKTQNGVDIRTQEMFGESYDPVENPVDENFLPPLPQVEEPGVPLPQTPAAPQDEADEPTGSFAMFAPGNTPDGKRDKKEKKDKKKRDADEASEVLEVPPLLPPTPPSAGKAGASRFDKAFTSTGPLSGDNAPPPAAGGEAGAPANPPDDSPFGANPDKRNAITTRSFSAPPRTGRPGKMPFRQGNPEDLDAIDE